MVKRLDDLIDHIGWDLWQAATAWQRQFEAAMIAAGHRWFGEARGRVLSHLDRAGMRQSDLAERMGITKQAVQQLVDELVRDGIVERHEDPTDRRARWIQLTASGNAVHADSNRIKRAIEEEWCSKLGARAFTQLRASLRRLGAE